MSVTPANQNERQFVRALRKKAKRGNFGASDIVNVSKAHDVDPERAWNLVFNGPGFYCLPFQDSGHSIQLQVPTDDFLRMTDTQREQLSFRHGYIPKWVRFIDRFIVPVVDWVIELKRFRFFAMLFALLGILLKVAAKGKSLITMILMIGIYAWTWGFPFALGFVLLLALHECGHMLVLRRYGIKTGLPVFIPFVGAVISMKEMPHNAWMESMVGIGGPLLGTIASLVCLLWADTVDSMLLQALAYVGFLINLFNLLPMRPLDGGRIIGAVSRWFLLVGFLIGIVFTAYHPSVMLIIITMLGFIEVLARLKMTDPGYFDVPWGKRILVGTLYLGLAGFLVYATEATHLSDSQMTAAEQMGLTLGPLLWALRGIGGRR